MKFVGYLAGCPAGAKNIHKHEIIHKFVKGVNAAGDTGILHTGKNILVDTNVHFIQGWVHQNSGTAPHLMVRKNAIEFARTHAQHVLVADSNLFNYIDANEKKSYTRYSFDGVFPTTGNYFDSMVDPTRWDKISKATGVKLKPWRASGRHILICTQRNGGWSMGGLDVAAWLEQTVKQIKQFTSRPIIVRGHPGDRYHTQYIDQKKYTLSRSKYIWEDFKDAHAVVTFNSSPGVAAAIEGIPVFVTDPNPRVSQAYDVSNHSIHKIENPRTFDRELWIQKLAMSHWNRDEIESGEAWRHIRNYV